MEPITTFAVGGGFAVVVAGILIKFVLDMLRRQGETISNHIEHSTTATIEMRDAIREQTQVSREHKDAIGELTQVIRELKDELRRANGKQ